MWFQYNWKGTPSMRINSAYATNILNCGKKLTATTYSFLHCISHFDIFEQAVTFCIIFYRFKYVVLIMTKKAKQIETIN